MQNLYTTNKQLWITPNQQNWLDETPALYDEHLWPLSM